MQRLKLLGLMIMAVFAFSAVVTSVAAAEETESFLPTGSAASPVTFTVSSGAGRLQSLAGLVIECKKDKGTGEITSKTLGKFTVEFEGCTGPLGVKCADLSRADSVGIIKVEGEFHLRMGLVSEGQPLGLIAFLVPDTHLLCSLALVVVLGCVVGEIDTALNTLVSTVEVLLKEKTGSPGDQNWTSTDPEGSESSMVACLLLSKKGSEAEESASEETHEVLSNFTQNGVSTTVLIHI